MGSPQAPPPLPTLVEVDSITIHAIVNDEIDQISPSPHPGVQHAQSFMGAPLTPLSACDAQQRGGAATEMRMDTLCCGAHGLSLLITAATSDGTSHTLLFDAGPEEAVWERNVARLGLDAGAIETIVLSHWHRDHSGGMLSAIRMVEAAKRKKGSAGGHAGNSGETTNHTTVTTDTTHYKKVVADLHPDRPTYRGVMAMAGGEQQQQQPIPISLEPDPTFEEIEQAGATVFKSSEPHTVLDGMFLVSGSIPRETAYEGGIRGGIRLELDAETQQQEWEKDELIMDERLVMCHLRGKGLVVFTGCSHAGVVNVARHAVALGGGGGRGEGEGEGATGTTPLYTVVGGYHLADASAEKMESSMRDLKALQPRVLMPGHCTGWRFKVKIEQEMPGCMAPVFGGTRYELV
ncbi:hypothetical protein SLS62_011411 [Diatrype stigma]|uniref:Metallo-beta-lactamase domain-containing protein n=1 Tax=Diatrype stigma TaxID=117547 RepID=A0AAN9U5E3_9PEZI